MEDEVDFQGIKDCVEDWGMKNEDAVNNRSNICISTRFGLKTCRYTSKS